MEIKVLLCNCKGLCDSFKDSDMNKLPLRSNRTWTSSTLSSARSYVVRGGGRHFGGGNEDVQA